MAGAAIVREALVEASSHVAKTYRVPAGPDCGEPNVTVQLFPMFHVSTAGVLYPEPGAHPAPVDEKTRPAGLELMVICTVEGTNTYAAPAPTMLLSAWLPLMPVALLASPKAPTTTVSALTATDSPNLSLVPVFDALR